MWSRFSSPKVLVASILFFVGALLLSWSLRDWSRQWLSNPGAQEVTASPAPSSPIEEPPANVTLLFGGDLMFDRHVRQAIQREGSEFVLEDLHDLLRTYDVVVANLEGPITDSASVSVGSEVGSSRNFIFTFDPIVTQILNQANIKVVNLGNNHILNFGEGGVEQTQNYLSEAGITFFGQVSAQLQPLNEPDDITQEKNSSTVPTYTVLTLRDRTIALINYNQFAAGGEKWAMDRAILDIQRVREGVDIVIVYTHWGDEYQANSSVVIQRQAHQFVDAGADVVIGAHPHVVQQREEYSGKTIYYSLGNFVFDQYFQPEVKQGLLVGVTIYPDNRLEFTEHQIQLQPGGKTLLR